MGWAAYVYIQIHSNNQKELDDYIKSGFEFLPSYGEGSAMRYDTYISISFWIPKTILANECDDIVREYKSFVIFTEWHEELNPDHGYYVTRWLNDDVESKSITFNKSCAEERGWFNRYSKSLKKVYRTIEYDKSLKNKIYTTLNLDSNHIGVYSYIWVSLKGSEPDIIHELLGLPEQCIRWHFNLEHESQIYLWSPYPLREMINEKFSDIVCEWWSADGKTGGVWVKKPKTEWGQSEDINDYITVKYPVPYIPCFEKKGIVIPLHSPPDQTSGSTL
jgi:hypothetical protein